MGSHPWEVAWREGRWKEVSPPLPAVVEFAKELKKAGARIVLDLGCGAGRHAIHLAESGIQVVALDVSDTALGTLSQRLMKAALPNTTLVRHEMSDLPFIDGYFDAVISTNVLHHGKLAQILQTINEIHRVMKDGATGFVVTLSRSDFRIGNGSLVEPNTYLFTEGDEKGIMHHFFSREELLSYFGKFEVLFLTEELFPDKKGNWAHFHLKFRKTSRPQVSSKLERD